MKIDGRCFLVTGAAGFIGSHLCERLLQEGGEVVGVDCFTDYYPPSIKRSNLEALEDTERFRLTEENILDLPLEQTLAGVDGVFHQAAQAGVRSSWGSEFDEYVRQNIQATQYLLEGLKNHAPECPLVMASSSSVYGTPDELPMHEEMRLRPYSPYGVTKLASENLGSLYHQNFGLPVVSLRYFTVYGPRQRPDMAFTRFLTWIHEDVPITVFGDGEQTRDFTYVTDAVDANMVCMRQEPFGRIYNVGGGQNASINEIIGLMESITGREVRRKTAPSQKGDVPHTEADTRGIRSDLSWSPEVSLHGGLEHQWTWIRSSDGVRRSVM